VVVASPLVAAVSAAAQASNWICDRVERWTWSSSSIAAISICLSGSMTSAGERFAATALLEDSFVTVMRRGHPATRRKALRRRVANLSHLEISSTREDTSLSTVGLRAWADAARSHTRALSFGGLDPGPVGPRRNPERTDCARVVRPSSAAAVPAAVQVTSVVTTMPVASQA